MAQAAYELERFAPRPKQAEAPRVRVAKKARVARGAGAARLARLVLTALVMVALVCGVLYNQAMATELQSEITQQKETLTEEQALNAYLTFELDNMTSLKNIEEGASAMGYEKIAGSQITYFRVEGSERIEVKQDALSQLVNNVKSTLLSAWETINPAG